MRVAVVACVAVLALALVSCSGGEKPKTAAELNRAYMSSVNQNVADLQSELTTFSSCVSNEDVAGMQLSVDRAKKIIDEIDALSVPEAFTEVHKMYIDGAGQLQDSLQSYVDLYAGIQAGTVDKGSIDTVVSKVQAGYDKGIGLLKQADAKLAEIAGVSSSDAAKSDASASSANGSEVGPAESSDASAAEGK